MKTINIFIISILFFTQIFSQNSEIATNIDSSNVAFTPTLRIDRNNINAPFLNKTNFSLQTGVSFCSFGKQNFFDKWIAPGITYSLTSKLHLTIGTVAMFSNFGSFQSKTNSEGIKTLSQNSSGQYFLFAQGDYLLSNKITLRGTILKEVPNAMNPHPLNINRVGVDYKVSDRCTLSFDCNMVKGYNSSLMRNSGNLNFSSSPFGFGNVY